MLTFTGGRNLYGKFTLNTQSDNLTYGDTLINSFTRLLIASRNWAFLEASDTISIVASTQSYTLTNPVRKVRTVTVTSGSTVYRPKKCPTYDKWLQLNQSTSVTSSYPEWFFTIGNTVLLYPTPSASITSGMTVYYYKGHIDLSIADYTTGAILTATADSAAIVGSGTSWTSQMAGKWLQIAGSNTANSGDNRWYKILSVTDTTHLTLATPYEGLSIAAGSATHTIGETSILPEDYQILPIYRAAELYFVSSKPDPDRAKLYKELYAEGLSVMIADQARRTGDPTIEDSDGEVSNSNLFVTY